MDQVKFPIVITNFKTFESSTGVQALALAKIHEEVAIKEGVNFAVCPQVVDIWMIASQINIPVFSHHFDAVTHGQFTGHIIPEALKAAGADGSLLNHAERKISLKQIAESIVRAREVGFFTLVCAKDLEEAQAIAKFNPDAIAIEPPELIGGDISVSTASPDIIKNAVAAIKNIPIIVGAGIKTGEDIRLALKFGAKGILVASAVTKAKDPRKILTEFAQALKG
ncbi:MAG: triose-phosphate isomerase [Candidatus Gracilibacteria bacterium]